MEQGNLPTHPWIVTLRQRLSGLETALLLGDANAVEAASAGVQAVLQQAPKTAEFGLPGSTLRPDMLQAAHHFGQLRQTVMRANAQNQRAINSLLPQTLATQGNTYGRGPVAAGRGAGQAYLSA